MTANKALICVLLFGLALNTLAIDWGIRNTHSWNPDDIAPDKPLRVTETYTKGWDKYPYLQSWIDFAIFSPVLFYWTTRETYFPGCNSTTETCFSDPYGQLSLRMILSRIVTAIMALGAVYWMYQNFTPGVSRPFGSRLGRANADVFECVCLPWAAWQRRCTLNPNIVSLVKSYLARLDRKYFGAILGRGCAKVKTHLPTQ